MFRRYVGSAKSNSKLSKQKYLDFGSEKSNRPHYLRWDNCNCTFSMYLSFRIKMGKMIVMIIAYILISQNLPCL